MSSKNVQAHMGRFRDTLGVHFLLLAAAAEFGLMAACIVNDVLSVRDETLQI